MRRGRRRWSISHEIGYPHAGGASIAHKILPSWPWRKLTCYRLGTCSGKHEVSSDDAMTATKKVKIQQLFPSEAHKVMEYTANGWPWLPNV